MKLISILTMAALLASPAAFANWVLSKDESKITFSSTKKENVVEVHTFEEFAGQVLKDGRATIDINLASAQTNIEIRNERLDTLLFDVSKFSGARVKGNVDVAKTNALAVGQSYTETLKLTLHLHGIHKEVSINVKVTKKSANKVQVLSVEPLLIKAGDYGLAEGVEALRKVANLSSISLDVPVTFDLLFTKK
ncbi:hypothetical protein NBRC116188_00480 [Oceaniserpentilla sp. 4NH20-0058]|uniref:YceI family protein n=1 Tax=Oceaniserpentilla sp. 4NH20-0058 TaxID=3127660 RepID=UPI003108ECA8